MAGYCSWLRRCQLSNLFPQLGFLDCRSLVRGTYSRRLQVVLPRCEHTERGLLQLMTHRPIAIDCAGTDGRAKSAGSAQTGLSTDRVSVGASVEQGAVPSAPPRPSARDKAAVRYRVEKERWLPKPPPQFQHWVWKFLSVYMKEALLIVNIVVCRILRG